MTTRGPRLEGVNGVDGSIIKRVRKVRVREKRERDRESIKRRTRNRKRVFLRMHWEF